MSKRNFTSARSKLPHRASVLVWLTLAITACTTAPAPRSVDTGALEGQARAESEAGHAGAAATLYERLANASPAGERAGYLIAAAKLHLEAREPAAARRALASASETATTTEHAEIATLTAEADLDQGNAAGALAALAAIPDTGNLALTTEIAGVRGRALFALGRYQDAVRVLAERELWLDTGPEILRNQELIWNGLARYPEGRALPAETGDPIIDGWLALAPIAASASDPDALKKALIEWRQRFPDHPAAGGYLANLLAERRGVEEFPQQIALLLPLSSAQQAAADAIRDGFITAYLEDARRNVDIKVYDTSVLGSSEAYLRAQLDGADFIVGPLLRPEVEQIAGEIGFVPTLALNFLPDGVNTGVGASFFQFALSPEDEAREVARHASARGARTALVLVPGDDLGRRLLASFRDEFQALGGRVLAVSTYDPGARDFSTPITNLLNLNGSRQRYRRLAANLGVALEFEPRRRADADMLFIAATPETGRLLAPQLRFYYAGDIPTYATSLVYEPAASGADNDLNGLYFPDVPWLVNPDGDPQRLRRMLASYWPQRSPWVRLYGMGYDAYHLIPMLFRHATTAPVEALSGELEVDANGQIHRRLPLAQFRDGHPVAIEAPQQPAVGLARRE